DDDTLAVPGHDHDVIEDFLIDPARRIDVRDRHECRARGELFDRASMLDGRHRDCILRLHAAYAARGPDDVRAFDVRLVNGEMPHGHRQIDGLHDDPTLPVQDT